MSYDDGRALGFGGLAEQYDQNRPTYPPGLVDDLVGGAKPTVLDVGCGTGIAARLFQARGCHVVGVEPDGRMAEVARRHGIDVFVSTFEDWEPREQFDLVVCGQAWHWIDAAKGSAKAAAALRPGGRFGAFWNNYAHTAALDRVFDELYGRLAPELLETSVALGRLRTDLASGEDTDATGLAATGQFVAIERRRYQHRRRYSAAQWVAELGTHSDHRLLPSDQRDALFAAIDRRICSLGGYIEVTLHTAMITALRKAAG